MSSILQLAYINSDSAELMIPVPDGTGFVNLAAARAIGIRLPTAAEIERRYQQLLLESL